MTRYPVLLFFVIFSFLPVILLGTGVWCQYMVFAFQGFWFAGEQGERVDPFEGCDEGS